jgi:transposase
MGKGESAEKVVREIQRRTRRRFSAEEKIRIVLEGLRGEESIAALCRCEGLAPNLYYRWSKEFLEAGKKRLLGDTKREASAPEVKGLRDENDRLKHALAETVLEVRLLKTRVIPLRAVPGVGRLRAPRRRRLPSCRSWLSVGRSKRVRLDTRKPREKRHP